MTVDFRYERMQESDLPAVARIISHAFAGTPDDSAKWAQKVGLEHFRTLRDTEAIRASLLRIPMGQFFGGRSVPLIGIAAVGVAPECRGRGIAAQLMAEAIRECAAEGVALSGLYAATQPLYRRVGYEQAGHRFEIRLPVRHIDIRDRAMQMRPIQPADRDRVRACYTAFASRFEGPLDRGQYVWARVEHGRETAYHGFAAIDDSGEFEGYVYLSQTRKPDRGRQEIQLSDIALTTARAARRLLGFLADFSSMADDIIFFGGPSHPLLALLAEQRYRMDLRDHWMIRIVDIQTALECRGYRCADTELHLHIDDALLPQNSGPWTFRISEGRVSVTRGGRAELRLSINALASLYSGLRSPHELALLGQCEGDPASMNAAASAFAGSTPWMSDMY